MVFQVAVKEVKIKDQVEARMIKVIIFQLRECNESLYRGNVLKKIIIYREKCVFYLKFLDSINKIIWN